MNQVQTRPCPARDRARAPAHERAMPPERLMPTAHSIGQHSRGIKTRHLLGRIWRVIAGVGAVIAASALISHFAHGMNFAGLLMTALSALMTAALLLSYPRLHIPRRAELSRGPPAALIGRTQLWLEGQQGALPPSAARVIGHIGILLDALAIELDRAGHDRGTLPQAARALVSEDLPDAVCAFIAGRDSEADLTARLCQLSHRIGLVTRRLAEG
jgi:hypothetical protein